MTFEIGELSFISGLPISYAIAHGLLDASALHRVVGRPGELDQRMAEGELAAGPISSLEYIRHRDRYQLVPDLSISSWGRIGSAVLFSRVSFPQLAGQTIVLPPFGATSNAMIRWLVQKMFGVEARYIEEEGSLPDLLSRYPAALVIGDQALTDGRMEDEWACLDLGEAWWQVMQTPFVTTVWACQATLPVAVQQDLAGLFTRAKALGRDHMGNVTAEASRRLGLPERDVEAYYALLNYDLTPVHEESIRLLAADLTAPTGTPGTEQSAVTGL